VALLLGLHLAGTAIATAESDPTLEAVRLAIPDPPAASRSARVPPRTYVTVDGVPFLARQAEVSWPTASTGKIMTAYTVLHDPSLPLRRVLTIDRRDVAEESAGYLNGDSEVPLNLGQRYTVLELLYALMLPSADDAADVLAEHSSGHMKGFLAEMNRLAHSLGLTSSHFTDPSGAMASNVSSARDLVVLTERALDDAAFARVVSTRTYRLPHVGPIGNLNWMLWNVDGAVGVKTGWTTAAHHSLVFAARRPVAGESALVVGAILGMGGGSFTPIFHEARALVDAAFRSAVAVRVAPQIVGRVRWGQGLTLPARIPVGWTMVVPRGTRFAVAWHPLHPPPSDRPVPVAEAVLTADGVPVAELPVLSPPPPAWYRSLYALGRILTHL
jgi:D-alanyl-D-alanine carboxypeptidase